MFHVPTPLTPTPMTYWILNISTIKKTARKLSILSSISPKRLISIKTNSTRHNARRVSSIARYLHIARYTVAHQFHRRRLHYNERLSPGNSTNTFYSHYLSDYCFTRFPLWRHLYWMWRKRLSFVSSSHIHIQYYYWLSHVRLFGWCWMEMKMVEYILFCFIFPCSLQRYSRVL